MKIYRVSRNGEHKGSYPLEKHADGTLWNGKNPLIDGESESAKKLGKDAIMSLIKAGKAAELPVGCIAKEGLSESGLEVIDYEEVKKQEQAALTPAQNERIRINNLFAKANARINDLDDNNVQDHFVLLNKAEEALKNWKINYPAETKEEMRDDLIAKAEEQESLASGALVYDADGWIDSNEQQKRHDAFIAKANEYREQAASL